MVPSLLSDEIVYHEQQLNRLIRERQLINQIIEHFQSEKEHLGAHRLLAKFWYKDCRYKVHVSIKQMKPLREIKKDLQNSAESPKYAYAKGVIPASTYESFIEFCKHNEGLSGRKKELEPLLLDHIKGFQADMWSVLMLRARLDKRVERKGKGRATVWTFKENIKKR